LELLSADQVTLVMAFLTPPSTQKEKKRKKKKKKNRNTDQNRNLTDI
jgi:hypothetical protein